MSETKTRGRPQTGPRQGTSIRLDDDMRARLDAIAAQDEASTGYRPALADVLRGCLRLGLDLREKQLGLKRGRGRT